jgi:hypothetical protein
MSMMISAVVLLQACGGGGGSDGAVADDSGGADGSHPSDGSYPSDSGASDTGEDSGLDSGTDGGVKDGGGVTDGGTKDGGLPDSGTDAGVKDGGADGGAPDAGFDAGWDGGVNGFVSITGGPFYMGCATGDTNCTGDDEPRHQVTVPSFQILRYEVSQGEYEAVMGTNPSYFAACGSRCPVEKVSWSDADSYCSSIGARLPSETEWEFAARAGSSSIWPCGDSDSCVGNTGWYETNSGDETHRVGTRTANAWGLYDMIGNVWEWVEDDYHNGYSGAPTDGSAWVDSPRDDKRVIRGGSYGSAASSVRASSRADEYPASVYDDIGFRCAK